MTKGKLELELGARIGKVQSRIFFHTRQIYGEINKSVGVQATLIMTMIYLWVE